MEKKSCSAEGWPGRAPALGCDGEQLVTAATAVCLADDVSASVLQSHRADGLQQTLSNEECVRVCGKERA